jgi:polar amino acid transport system substrate-binding protein
MQELKMFRFKCLVQVALLSNILLAPNATSAAELLRVAVNKNFPPFVEVVNGEPKGPLVDFLAAAAKHASLRIEFVPVSLDQWQSILAQGRADAFYPMAITPALRQAYDFSDPLTSSGGALFMRAPEKTPVGLDALVGKTVVTPKVGPLAAYIEKNAPGIRLVVTKDYEESLAKLVSGEADAAALNLQVGARIADQLYPGRISHPDRYFWELPLAVAMPKAKGDGSKALDALNGGIAAVKAQGVLDRMGPAASPR